MVSLISALFASWFSYGLSGIYWLFLNWGCYTASKRKMALTVLNVGITALGATLCGLGLWVSIKSISDDSKSGKGSFSCADNST